MVTPHSDTILPSITRRSLLYVAEHYLGLEVEERDVYLEELKEFAECGLCGTAGSSLQSERSWIMDRRFVSRAEWKRWDRPFRNYMIP